METEINYITFDAILRKKEDKKWVLFLQLDPSLEIDLSATEQDYLKNVFNTLIKKFTLPSRAASACIIGFKAPYAVGSA